AVRRLWRELQHQAFGEVAGADARRVELLNNLERLFDLMENDWLLIAPRQLLQRHLHPTSWIDVADDESAQFNLFRFEIEERKLVGEIIVERLRAAGHSLHCFVLLVALFMEAVA